MQFLPSYPFAGLQQLYQLTFRSRPQEHEHQMNVLLYDYTPLQRNN